MKIISRYVPNVLIAMSFLLIFTGCHAGQIDESEYDSLSKPIYQDTLDRETPEVEPVEELTPEEIRELLNSIPHPGMRSGWPAQVYPIADSELGIEMADFIAGVITWIVPPPSVSFTSPAEIDPMFALRVSLFRTSNIQALWPESENYHPELKGASSVFIPAFPLAVCTKVT